MSSGNHTCILLFYFSPIGGRAVLQISISYPLFQNPDDLFFAEPAVLHAFVFLPQLRCFGEPSLEWLSSVGQGQSQYPVAENRVMRSHLPARVPLTNSQRMPPAELPLRTRRRAIPCNLL